MPCVLRVLVGEAVLVAIVGVFASLRAGAGASGPTGEKSDG
jgi:hypothetical protein